MRHAVIMAGGSGTRLWPLSRRSRPKQLMRIFDGQSLLRRSFERLNGLLPPEQIYVIASKEYLPAMQKELPEMPQGNFLGEPCPRDTANAVGLAAHLLALKDPEGTMGVFTADQIIRPVDVFQETVRKGFEAAEKYPQTLVTFGIKPKSPHTGYGYVHCGPALDADAKKILEFKEKPDLATAERYLASAEYLWNSGMFVWRIATIIDELKRHEPEIDRGLRDVVADFGKAREEASVFERFSRLPRISIDFAVMERASRVAAVEMNCDWLDVGSWNSLAEIFKPDKDGNTIAGPHAVSLDSNNNVFVSESPHLIAAIGVEDLIVIHSDDATLICRREDHQKIKDMVAAIKSASGEQYM